MEGSEGSPPQSLCMIRAAELFPKTSMEKEDTQLTVPFQERKYYNSNSIQIIFIKY